MPILFRRIPNFSAARKLMRKSLHLSQTTFITIFYCWDISSSFIWNKCETCRRIQSPPGLPRTDRKNVARKWKHPLMSKYFWPNFAVPQEELQTQTALKLRVNPDNEFIPMVEYNRAAIVWKFHCRCENGKCVFCSLWKQMGIARFFGILHFGLCSFVHFQQKRSSITCCNLHVDVNTYITQKPT